MKLAEIKSIREAISPEDQANLDAGAYQIVDSVNIGDHNVHLAYMYHPVTAPDGVQTRLEVGLQQGDQSFTTPENQVKQFGNAKPLNRHKLTDTIRGWCRKYGPIIIRSYDPRKNQIYFKLFSAAGFKVVPIPSEETPGFYVAD